MAVVSLFWDTNMAAVRSCENFSHDVTVTILVSQNKETAQYGRRDVM